MIFNDKWCYVNIQKANDPCPTELTPEGAMISAVISYFERGQEDLAFESIDKDIKLDYFNTPEAKLIWSSLVHLKSKGMSLDLITLFSVMGDVLRDDGQEAPKNLSSICSNLFKPEFKTSSANLNYFVRRLFDSHYRREINEALKEPTPDAFKKGEKIRLKIEGLSSELDKSVDSDIHSFGDTARELFDAMLDKENHPENYDTISWGYMQHDEKIQLARGHLVVIGGRSGSGKTTYAMNVLKNQLLMGKKCAVFSLEMSRSELAQILISQISGVPHQLFFNSGKMKPAHIEKIQNTLDIFNEKFNGAFVDLPAQSMEDIRRRSIQIKTKKLNGLDFIFVDHIHIMGDSEGRRFNSVREKIMHISASLKNLAKELDVTVIALAQMNRNSESRGDRTPTLADLKESGSLEQDADTIVFTYRGTDTNQVEEPYIICRKNRHGELNDFKICMMVNPTTKTFEEA